MNNTEIPTDRIQENQFELALRDSQARLTGIIASAMDAIITTDEQRNILLFNAAAEKMFGYSSDQVLGQKLEILMPERFRKRHEEHIRLFGATGITNRSMGRLGTLYGLRSSGEEFQIEASISQVQLAQGKLFTVILRDVTERVEAEAALKARNEEIQMMTQQLWQTAKLATMGELSASIAHELNNPLAILSLRLELIYSKIPPEIPVQADLQIMEQEVERMAMLVSNLLQFSRAGQRQVSTLDVRDEVEKTLELVHNHLVHHKITVERRFSDPLPFIQADRQQLRQLFLNLITNASDAMPAGGTLTIGIQPVDRGQPAVQVELNDTGTGIPSELLAKVMDPFYTSKAEGKGTGLGLAICKRIVEEHHGLIEITSPGINQGTTIRMIFPTLSQHKPDFQEEDG